MKFLNKHGQTIAFLIGGILALYAIIQGLTAQGQVDSGGAITANVNMAVQFAIIAMIVALAIWVILELIFLAGQPKKAVKGVIGIGALVAIYFVAKSIGSTPDLDAQLAETYTTSKTTILPGQVGKIGAGIITTFVLIIIAIAAFVWGELKSLFS